MSTNWSAWHDDYASARSPLSERLAVVRTQIDQFLDATAPDEVRALSLCAGEGRDLLGVLSQRPDADRVTGLMVEADGELAARAAVSAKEVDARIDLVQADAAMTASYHHGVPAGLVLLCGIFGNVSDADVRTIIEFAPCLCRTGALVIWTRHRGAPDLTPSVRGMLDAQGFEEVAFVAPADRLWAVGAHRYLGDERPLLRSPRLFTFLR